MDDYRNSPTIKFCADLFPAHRRPSVLLLRCSRWSLDHRSSDVKSSTARVSSHLSNRALLFLQPASTVVCLRHTLRFANSKQRMNKISPKPCHKKCRSANLRVCKSASLQVCRSAGLQSAFVAHRSITGTMIPDMPGFGRTPWKTLAGSTNSTTPCSAHFTEDFFEAQTVIWN